MGDVVHGGLWGHVVVLLSRKLSHLLINDISIDELFLIMKIISKTLKNRKGVNQMDTPTVRNGTRGSQNVRGSALLGSRYGVVFYHPLITMPFSRCREYIQKSESVKAKMNGQRAPGLDGFWFLDSGQPSGKRIGVGWEPGGFSLKIERKYDSLGVVIL
jgi:hypothetical protein